MDDNKNITDNGEALPSTSNETENTKDTNATTLQPSENQPASPISLNEEQQHDNHGTDEGTQTQEEPSTASILQLDEIVDHLGKKIQTWTDYLIHTDHINDLHFNDIVYTLHSFTDNASTNIKDLLNIIYITVTDKMSELVQRAKTLPLPSTLQQSFPLKNFSILGGYGKKNMESLSINDNSQLIASLPIEERKKFEQLGHVREVVSRIQTSIEQQ